MVKGGLCLCNMGAVVTMLKEIEVKQVCILAAFICTSVVFVLLLVALRIDSFAFAASNDRRQRTRVQE